MEDPYGPVPVAVEAGRVEPHKSAVAEIQAVVAYEEPATKRLSTKSRRLVEHLVHHLDRCLVAAQR